MNGDQIRANPPRRSAERGWWCPDDQILAAYADTRLEGAARGRLEKHLASCEFCRGQVAAMAKLAEEPLPDVAPGLIARAESLRAPRRAPNWRWAAAAGAVACLALVMTPLLRRSEAPPKIEEPRVVRQAPSAAIRPELQFPLDGAEVAGQNLELRWRGMEGALFYEVRILTADGDEVWKGRSDGTSVRVPDDAALAAGQKYYVWVSALLPDGKSAKSAATAFTVSR